MRAPRWPRRRRPPAWLIDGLLAAALTGLVLADLAGNAVPSAAVGYRPVDGLGIALALAQTVPVAWHRRAPGLVLGITLGAYLLTVALGYPMALGLLGTLVPLYGVALRKSRPAALAALGLCEAAAALTAVIPRPGASGRQVPELAVLFAAVWLLGTAHRRLRQEREANARRAVIAERARIARDLHDIVAHHVSAMAIQANAARTVLTSDPEQADAALRFIRDTCTGALTELRRLVGLLSGADEGAGEGAGEGADEGAVRAPQPGLDRLGDLAARTSAAGLPVDLVVEGTPRPLPAAMEVSAYRIVQEALTNSLRHAGPARARVVVRHAPDHLELRVLDDGGGPSVAAGPRPGGGYGLVGMRERAAVFGGTLTAGPRPGGGFQVLARLPVPPAANGDGAGERAG